MAEKLQIDVGVDQSITAIHSVPFQPTSRRMEQTLVLMSHGFPGNKAYHNDLYGRIETLLNNRGYHTFRFDYRGCGESDGQEKNFTLGSACEDFQSALYWSKSKGYKRFIYIGEGLGSSLSTMNMDLDVIACIMLWPVFDLDLYRKSAFGITQITEAQMKAGYVEINDRRIGVNFLAEMAKIDIRYAIKEIFAPTLILHGADDKAVEVEQLDLARRYIPAKRVEITTFHDGIHGLPQENHRKNMMFQIQQFIEKYA